MMAPCAPERNGMIGQACRRLLPGLGGALQKGDQRLQVAFFGHHLQRHLGAGHVVLGPLGKELAQSLWRPDDVGASQGL
jgi:hypothetical protein